MRIVFMGSSDLSCRVLQALRESSVGDVAGIVTQPDRPRGRTLRLQPSPLGAFAAELSIPLLTPARVNDTASRDAIRDLTPDAMVVVAYAQFLKQELLVLPRLGCVNVHTSLLPKYRGAAPIQWAVARGETITGVTTMRMDAGMDTGDILLQREVPIAVDDTAGTLEPKIAAVGGDLVVETLRRLAAGSLAPRPQDHAEATFAPRLSKKDGEIDWTLPARELYNRVRGFNPWPGGFCMTENRTGHREPLKVYAVRVEAVNGHPGRVLDLDASGPLVGTGAEALRLLEVQPAGGKRMSGGAYLRGHGWEVGRLLRTAE